MGNLITVADNHINPASGVRTQASDTMAFTYTTRDQLDLESHNHLLVGRNVSFDHDYDANGRQTRLATNINGTISGSAITGGLKDFVNNYAYDGRSQWTSVSQASQSGGHAVAPKLATFTHDIAGQTTDVRRYSSATVVPANLDVHSRFGHDAAGRQTNITHAKNEITAGQQWTNTSTLASSLTGGNLLAGYVTSFDAACQFAGDVTDNVVLAVSPSVGRRRTSAMAGAFSVNRVPAIDADASSCQAGVACGEDKITPIVSRPRRKCERSERSPPRPASRWQASSSKGSVFRARTSSRSPRPVN